MQKINFKEIGQGIAKEILEEYYNYIGNHFSTDLANLMCDFRKEINNDFNQAINDFFQGLIDNFTDSFEEVLREKLQLKSLRQKRKEKHKKAIKSQIIVNLKKGLKAIEASEFKITHIGLGEDDVGKCLNELLDEEIISWDDDGYFELKEKNYNPWDE